MSEASRVFPEPPFAPELIAEHHAGALDDKLAAHIRHRLPEDPEAQDLLVALDTTVEILGSLPAPAVTVPEHVRAASEATLSDLERRADTGEPPAPSGPRHPGLLLAAAVAGVLLCGILVALMIRPDQASPDSADQVAATDTAALLAAVRAPQTEEFDANRLARCLRANQLGSGGVVGAGYLIYQGRPAQVILTPTGRPGRFHALVTTRDCDAGKPGTIARAVVSE